LIIRTSKRFPHEKEKVTAGTYPALANRALVPDPTINAEVSPLNVTKR
jgi:hypothetical protein